MLKSLIVSLLILTKILQFIRYRLILVFHLIPPPLLEELSALIANFDTSIVVDHARSNEISDDGLLDNMFKNENVTSGDSFNFNNFNLNDASISNNNSNLIMNPDPEVK